MAPGFDSGASGISMESQVALDPIPIRSLGSGRVVKEAHDLMNLLFQGSRRIGEDSSTTGAGTAQRLLLTPGSRRHS